MAGGHRRQSLTRTSVLRLLVLLLLLSLGPFCVEAQANKTLTKIVVLGDSIADGFGVAKERAYPALLESSLKAKGHSVQVINAGISGSTTASALSRLKWQLRDKPKILVLELGGNDGLRGIDVDASKQNLSKAILLATKSGVQVLLTGMKLPQNYGKKYRLQFESMFQDLSKKHKTAFMPFLLEGVGGVPEFNLADGIHPNEKGHQKIADNLLPYIEKLL